MADAEYKIRDVVRRLCEKAKDANLGIEEFHASWPKGAEHPLYRQIFLDLEEGVEHVPGYFFKDGINYRAWYNAHMDHYLYLDWLILGQPYTLDRLEQCRTHLIAMKGLSKKNMPDAVVAYFKNH